MSGLRGLRAWNLETPQGERWEERALCRPRGGGDPEWWYSDKAADKATAMEWCAACPVRARCLAETLKEEKGNVRGMWYGIRAGYTGPQRRRLSLGKPAGAP